MVAHSSRPSASAPGEKSRPAPRIATNADAHSTTVTAAASQASLLARDGWLGSDGWLGPEGRTGWDGRTASTGRLAATATRPGRAGRLASGSVPGQACRSLTASSLAAGGGGSRRESDLAGGLLSSR